MPTLIELLKSLPDVKRATFPDDRDRKAAQLLLDGKRIYEALKEAGFPESTCLRGKASITGAIVQAMKEQGPEFAHIGNLLRRDPENVKELVTGFLYTSLLQRSSKGVNAAKLMGSIKEIDMFAKPEAQTNVVVVQAPADWHGLPEQVKQLEQEKQPKALPPAEVDMPDYE